MWIDEKLAECSYRAWKFCEYSLAEKVGIRLNEWSKFWINNNSYPGPMLNYDGVKLRIYVNKKRVLFTLYTKKKECLGHIQFDVKQSWNKHS